MIQYYALIRELAQCFLNKDGSYRVSPKGVWGRRNITNEKYKFICKLLDLNLKTDALREVVKHYILNSGETVRSSADWYNEKYGTDYNYVAIQNAFNYDRNKILSELSIDSLSKLFYEKENMSEELKIVEKLIYKYSEKKDWNSGTPLDLKCSSVKKNISEEDFVSGLEVIARYSWRNIAEVSYSIPTEFKEYLNYLSSELDLTGEDKKRFDLINDILDMQCSDKSKAKPSMTDNDNYEIKEMII